MDLSSANIDATLAVRFDSDAGSDLTLRQWLVDLLARVWDEQEMFSGKRAWGNSGWDWDPLPALIRAGFVEGSFDEDGYPQPDDGPAYQALIARCIERLGSL